MGSGAVVVALAKELPEMHWIGVDLSAAALAVARDNARRHGVDERVHLLQADLLTGLKPQASFDLLVANLPYVPQLEWEQLPREIKDFEPHQALLAGKDGLDLIRPLVQQAHQYIKAGGWVLLEVGDRQAEQVAALFAETGAYERVEKIKDFNGIDRVVQARRRRNPIKGKMTQYHPCIPPFCKLSSFRSYFRPRSPDATWECLFPSKHCLDPL